MDITEILAESNIEYKEAGAHHHTRPGWVNIDCPMCGRGSGKFHLGINISHGYANCWKCGPISLFTILRELTSASYEEIKEVTRGYHGRVEKGKKKTGKLKIPDNLTPLSKQAIEYLVSRNFNPKTIERLWQVRSTGCIGRLQWRIWIPIYYQGQVVSWTTRAIGNDSTRYVTAKPEEESMFHKHLLYGEDYVRHSIVVTEGPLDVWALGPGAVCTFGLNFSIEQVEKISKYAVRTICFDADNDPKTQQRASMLSKQLEPFPGVTNVVKLESGKDLAECAGWELNDIRRLYLI